MSLTRGRFRQPLRLLADSFKVPRALRIHILPFFFPFIFAHTVRRLPRKISSDERSFSNGSIKERRAP